MDVRRFRKGGKDCRATGRFESGKEPPSSFAALRSAPIRAIREKGEDSRGTAFFLLMSLVTLWASPNAATCGGTVLERVDDNA